MHKKNEVLSLQSLASHTLERLQKNKTPSQVYSPLKNSVSYRNRVSDIQNVNPHNTDMFQFSCLSDEYEERLAIAEYDGQQTSSQAERIAYLDAFVAVLLAFPHENTEGDWLSDKVVEAKKWLLDQGITQPK